MGLTDPNRSMRVFPVPPANAFASMIIHGHSVLQGPPVHQCATDPMPCQLLPSHRCDSCWFIVPERSHLGEGLVGSAAVVVGTVGEEEVDDETDDGEDEDAEAPEQLVDGRAVGLEDLDEYYNVEDQDDEADDATTGAVLPAVVDGAGGDLLCHGGGEGEGSQAELEEERVDVLIHVDIGVLSRRFVCFDG